MNIGVASFNFLLWSWLERVNKSSRISQRLFGNIPILPKAFLTLQAKVDGPSHGNVYTVNCPFSNINKATKLVQMLNRLKSEIWNLNSEFWTRTTRTRNPWNLHKLKSFQSLAQCQCVLRNVPGALHNVKACCVMSFPTPTRQRNLCKCWIVWNLKSEFWTRTTRTRNLHELKRPPLREGPNCWSVRKVYGLYSEVKNWSNISSLLATSAWLKIIKYIGLGFHIRMTPTPCQENDGLYSNNFTSIIH